MGGNREGGRPGALKPIAAVLADVGPRWQEDIRRNSQIIKDAYAPLLAQAPKDGITVSRDLAYGAHARQRVDIFHPEGASSAPIVAFVHGGAFVRGDKRTSDELYDNVLYWFARHGFVGINVEYRLAPEVRHPAGAEDVRDALDWVVAHAGEYGGDPRRLLLVGHSAGGTHAASYVFDPSVAQGKVRASALVLISARLRADRLASNPNAAGVAAYYGDESTSDDLHSPMHHAALNELPTLVVAAEFENPWLDTYARQFADRLTAERGYPHSVVQMRGHNHMSVVAHFNTDEDDLGRRILKFFDAPPGLAEINRPPRAQTL